MACIKKEKNRLIVSQAPLSTITEKYKCLDNSLFDFNKLKPKQKLLNYLEPLLGKYKKESNSYTKLTSKIK